MAHSRLKLSLQECREIEDMFTAMYHEVLRHSDLLGDMAERALHSGLTQENSRDHMGDVLGLYTLETAARIFAAFDPIMALIQKAKRAAPVELDSGYVKDSVQQLFADIKKDMP